MVFLLGSMLVFPGLSPVLQGQDASANGELRELDESDLYRQLEERRLKVSRLTAEEKDALLAARAKAAEDPEVQAALARRDRAVREFRAAIRAALLKVDPELEPVLRKMMSPRGRGF